MQVKINKLTKNLGSEYKRPVTYALVGVKGEPIGVKVTAYNTVECAEQGLFFPLDPAEWRKLKRNQKQKKYNGLAMVEEYNLTPILKSYGFKILQEYVYIDQLSSKFEIMGVRSLKSTCNIDLLASILSVENFLKYLREKTDLLKSIDS